MCEELCVYAVLLILIIMAIKFKPITIVQKLMMNDIFKFVLLMLIVTSGGNAIAMSLMAILFVVLVYRTDEIETNKDISYLEQFFNKTRANVNVLM